MADPARRAAAQPVSALQHARSQHPAVAQPALAAAEYPNLGYLVIRGRADESTFADAAAAVLGARLPVESGTVVRCRAGVVLWQSPDEWWLACARADRDAIVSALQAALKDCFAQVVDTSGGTTALHVHGRDWSTLLRHLSPFDFDRLAVGHCASTVVGKAGYTVVRTGATAVTLLFRRSFAAYIWDLIDRAAMPYGLALVDAQAAPDGLFSTLLAPVGMAPTTPPSPAR